MKNPNLGTLTKVSLRDIWKTEAQDFTPWLAQEKNLNLLGDTIGMEVELEAQEKSVGPFRADILCRDTANDSWVLIENQLELTDHRHLGQILTYAAGLKAVSIVWIAERFTDEHQATVEWLNEVTGEEINFFGLEIELWQIGESPIAPKFNIVAKPNEWTKAGGTVKKNANITPTKQLQQEFWLQFRKFVIEQDSIIKPTKALPQHWMNIAIGTGRAYIYAFVDTRDKKVGVRLVLNDSEDRLAHFHLLKEQKVEIEASVGAKLIWEELPEKKSSYINCYKLNTDPKMKKNWKSQQQFLLETLEAYHKTFSQRIKDLDAGDYQEVTEEP